AGWRSFRCRSAVMGLAGTVFNIAIGVTDPAELVENQHESETGADQDADGYQVTGVKPGPQTPAEQAVGPHSGYKIAEGGPGIAAALGRFRRRRSFAHRM